MTSDQRSD